MAGSWRRIAQFARALPPARRTYQPGRWPRLSRVSGAFDRLGPHRAALMNSLGDALKAADQHAKAEAIGQADMFGVLAEEPEQIEQSYAGVGLLNLLGLFRQHAEHISLADGLGFRVLVSGFQRIAQRIHQRRAMWAETIERPGHTRKPRPSARLICSACWRKSPSKLSNPTPAASHGLSRWCWMVKGRPWGYTSPDSRTARGNSRHCCAPQ